MKKIALLLGLVLLLSGCDLLLERAAAQFSVAIEPQELSLSAGESENITIAIKPLTGIELSIATTKITLFEAPEGVTISAETIEIGTGSEPKPVTVIVDKDAEPIVDGEVRFEAIREGLTQYGSLKLEIKAATE